MSQKWPDFQELALPPLPIKSMMKSYLHSNAYRYTETPTVGVLLTNLGTPTAPTPAALREFLGEFLADPRVTEVPRWLWWLILHGVILRLRPRRSAQLYQKIWTEQGSPLLVISQAQVRALQHAVTQRFQQPVTVALGMRYGKPSIADGLAQLQRANAQQLLILPLYPQYASPSAGSTLDAVSDVFKRWRWLPEIRFIPHYYNFAGYICALVAQIQDYWEQHGRPVKLLFSFHGIPKRFAEAGDPYPYQCQETARLVAEQLELAAAAWQVVFQSRFGREEWLQPYTDHTLTALGRAGCQRVDIICPGFAADCLETLEEINQLNRQQFLAAGGKEFHYIPALNDSPAHIAALLQLMTQSLQEWSNTPVIQE